MKKRRARGETTTQQLLRWEKEDVCAGLTNAQAAEVLGISASTANEDWRYAKSWLRVEMGEAGNVND